jgi:hypothetical protein
MLYKWYNPRTGKIALNGTVNAGSGVKFTAPDSKDWTLHVTSRPTD